MYLWEAPLQCACLQVRNPSLIPSTQEGEECDYNMLLHAYTLKIFIIEKKNPRPRVGKKALTHMVVVQNPQLCLAVISGLAGFLRADVVCPVSTVSPGVGIGLCHNSCLNERRQSQGPCQKAEYRLARTLEKLPLRWAGACLPGCQNSEVSSSRPGWDCAACTSAVSCLCFCAPLEHTDYIS